MPCRIDRKRLWTHRISLESRSHASSVFVTLTYENSPPNESLNSKDTQDWLKRIRKSFGHPLRYFLVGEYGDSSFRPHYHLALFGYPQCLRGRTDRKRLYITGKCCPHCELVHQTWGHGMIDLASLTLESAGYIAGYTTKKMTKPNDPRLGGRSPEFARMSLRPGLGAHALGDFAEVLLTNPHAMDQFFKSGELPSSLRTDGKSLPLGRYLRSRLHEQVEFGPQASQKIREERLRAELSAVWQDPDLLEVFQKENGFEVLSDEEKAQKVRSLEKRMNMFKSRKSL